MTVELGELEESSERERRLHALRDAHNAMRVFIAIIMAVALKEALVAVFMHESGGVKLLAELTAQELLLFGVFVIVLGRFFIGDLRHLDAAHFESLIGGEADDRLGRPLHRLVDLHLLLLRGVLLFYLALSLHEFGQFFVLYLGILVVDIGWVAVIAGIGVGGVDRSLLSRETHPELLWGLNSLGFLVLLGALYVAGQLLEPAAAVERGLFAVLVLANSALDYRLAWHYYFPHPTRSGS